MNAADSPFAQSLRQAVACHQRGELARARSLYERILESQPRHFDALHLLGVVAAQSGNPRLAVELIGTAIEINPRDPNAHGNRAAALQELGAWEDALVSYEHAIALSPVRDEFHFQRGNVLCRLRRFEDALASYERAIARQPNRAEAHSNRGLALSELGRLEEALASFDRAIALKPAYGEAYANRASTLRSRRRFDEAVATYDRAIALNCDVRYLRGMRLHTKMTICDWSDFQADVDAIFSSIERRQAPLNPFAIMTLVGSAQQLRAAAELWVQAECPPNPALGPIPARHRHGKIRVGYFSADFRNHPVAMLTAQIYELHDRSRFEVTAFSLGPETTDALRLRLQEAFDAFIDVRGRSDREIAQLARRLEIDIAVDLGGFTEGARPGIFAMRAAPVQVSYIGYLGTMGAPYMDYLIADRTIVPAASRQHYAEKIVYLPSYQANDSTRIPADQSPSREQLGLPSEAFVFCCFNASFKITPDTFASWMRIMQRVPGSVLYLFAESETARANLRHAAGQRGVDADRLYFGERLAVAEYLARYRAADLFLDTLPYNAGTTASDALWAGLPVLTCAGNSFAGRVAASLLTAVGIPELIAADRAEYERLAVDLATDRARFAAIKRKLELNRLTTPLFDAPRFTEHLEAAYLAMFERHQAVLPPDHIGLDDGTRPVPSAEGAPLPEKFQRAVLLHRDGNLERAQSLYQEILAAEPKHFDALHLAGMLATQIGDPLRAVDLIGRALAIDPDNALAQFNLASALQDLKRWDAALCTYTRAIAIKSDFAEAHSNCGVVLQQLKRWDAALASYERAIAIKPDDAIAHANRGAALCELGNFETAVASCEVAVSIDPNYAEAYCNRGNALRGLGQLSDAIASYERALAIRPDYPEAHVNRGNLLTEIGRLTEARESFDRAIALRVDFAEGYFGRSVASLLGGDLASGWIDYEWRWRNPAGPNIREKRDFREPLWLGQEPLAGKRILLHAEQGLGDTLQFCRYAARVAERGATVILEVPDPLVGLLSRLEGVSAVCARGGVLPEFELQCPLMSLPLAFRTTLDSIPGPNRYLHGDSAKVSQWRSGLGEQTRPRIGLVWSGSTIHPNDRHRSVALAELMGQMPRQADYFCLQKDVREADRAALESQGNLFYFPDDLNFESTAALCELLDLVISVDTSIAHLSGALGRKTWILLPFNPDWRWLLNRADTPWYPSARLYRQPRIGEWSGILSQVASDLSRMFDIRD